MENGNINTITSKVQDSCFLKTDLHMFKKKKDSCLWHPFMTKLKHPQAPHKSLGTHKILKSKYRKLQEILQNRWLLFYWLVSCIAAMSFPGFGNFNYVRMSRLGEAMWRA
jgi:hypothetical protein